jgi:hypothetical protein
MFRAEIANIVQNNGPRAVTTIKVLTQMIIVRLAKLIAERSVSTLLLKLLLVHPSLMGVFFWIFV